MIKKFLIVSLAFAGLLVAGASQAELLGSACIAAARQDVNAAAACLMKKGANCTAKTKDVGMLEDSVDAIREDADGADIDLFTKFETADGKGAFQVIDHRGALNVTAKPGGTFDTVLCSDRNGVIALVPLSGLPAMVKGTRLIAFSIVGQGTDKILLTTDHPDDPKKASAVFHPVN
jgi:hypothetical protein